MNEHATPAPEPNPSVPQFKVAGFWRRVFAFVIDYYLVTILVGIAGNTIEFLNIGLTLGQWNHVLPYAALIAYFAYFDSEKSKKPSIGKRITKIRVVGSSGKPITFKQALMRACLSVPTLMFNYWAPFPEFLASRIISTTIYTGGQLSLAYAFVINRKTRQGIHDILVGTYVVEGERAENFLPAISEFHKFATFLLLVPGLVLAIVIYVFPQSLPDFRWSLFSLPNQEEIEQVYVREGDNMQELARTIYALGGLETVNIDFYNSYSSSTSDRSEVFALQIAAPLANSCFQNKENCNEFAKKIAKETLSTYPNLNQFTHIRIVFVIGHNLVVTKGTETFVDMRSIDEWREIVDGSLEAQSATSSGVQQYKIDF
jgi:uncharacterized RDD family membrane protein YckC